jgi:mono/diheme cytochrome c family protein
MRSPLGTSAAAIAAAVMLVALPGCRAKDTTGDVVNGKKLFVAKCGACHQLARAGSKGVTGPDLDAAFRQDLKDGIPRDSVRGVVHQQILYPGKAGTMPAKLYKGQDAWDVASYVAAAVDKRGKDTGALAAIGGGAKKNATAKNGTLDIPTDPSGQLAYLVGNASAPAGALTIDSVNKASIGHNIALSGPGVNSKGPVVSGGKTSSIKVNLKPGKYTFFCSVPGHEQAGMKGTLTVK